jgi:CRP-like cAMP-binding protein
VIWITFKTSFAWQNPNRADSMDSPFVPNSSSPARDFTADPELIAEVERQSRACAPINDGVLFRRGQFPPAVYLVKSGEVTLAIEAGDRMILCLRVGGGSLLGLPAVVSDQPYSMTAAPCPGADIREIGGPEFLALVAESPALALKVIRVLACEVRLARRSQVDLMS